MNRTELVETISNECDVSKALAKRMLDSFENAAINTLKKGSKFELLDFFTLTPYKTKARTIRDLRSQNLLKIKPRHRVKFRMGKGFKEALN